ncbi:MAG: preprotein translocase subunit SecE [Solitalea-like symbiont of Acarus siro]
MSSFLRYIKDSKDELINKVSWPSYREVLYDAIFVLISCIILSLVVFVIDKFLGEVLISTFYKMIS